MNILIIDDLFVPEKAKANSPEKLLFCNVSEENRKRRIFLAKEFQKLGADVLLLRLELRKKDFELSFSFREEEGLSQLFVQIPASSKKNFLRLSELFKFSAALSENAPGLAGIFSPDVVIAGGILPFSVSASAKLAKASGAVLITELCCAPKETLLKFGLCSPFNPVLKFLSKSVSKAFSESYAVFGAFPEAARKFSGAHNLYPVCFPSESRFKEPSEKSKTAKEQLFSYSEGKTFVLAFCGEPEEGFSVEELILSSGTFGNRFTLVFPFEGQKNSRFKRFVAEKGITNVFFPEDFPKEDAEFILSGADAVFVSESDFGKGIFPEQGNFWKAFGAQKPVIAASEHWSDFFRKTGGVIITKPRRKDSIALGIKTLLGMSEADRETLGRANFEFYEKNSAENFAKECFSLFDNFVNQKEIKK